LLPLITGFGRKHHGEILAHATALVEAGKLKPILDNQRFTTRDIGAAHARLSSGGVGRVVVEI
jgi:NADPH:quinone reductase